MFVLAALCLLAGILPGLVIDALAPVARRHGRRQHAAAERRAWLSIVPIAESRSSYNGLLVFLFIAFSALARRAGHPSLRLGQAAARSGLGLRLSPIRARQTQYTASSFAQPIRRVFGTLVFRAREQVEMPPPGDMRPARLVVRPHAISIWDALYAPVAGAVGYVADRLNRLQFLTIRRYLELRLRRAGRPAAGARDMAMIARLLVQGAQMLLVLLLAPLLTGFVRKVKARLLRRQGPPLIQPYRDLLRLLRKEVVLAENASWLFRVAPYLIFAATWVAAALVPTFATGLLFSWSADLIAIIALLGSARFFLALAGMDVGTSFGGIGSSREVMIASLAEPAMLMIVFTLALVAGSTQLSTIADYMASPAGRPARFARAGAGRAHHGGDRRERAHPGGQSGDAPRTHDGARGDGAGIFRPASGDDRARRGAQAAALRLADRLRVLALGHRRAGRRARGALPSASSPISPSSRSAACCSPCSKRRSPRCACSACPTSWAPR